MGNQQLSDLTNQEVQLIASSYFGDGYFKKPIGDYNMSITLGCVHKDYLTYKESLCKNLITTDIKNTDNSLGYNKKGRIYKLRICSCGAITEFYDLPLYKKLSLLDELGVAMWFYDDGSLHKNKYFYNLSTHSFTLKEQMCILRILKRFDIDAVLTKEVKKDGREFTYLRIGRYEGSYEISKLMSMIPIESMAYKLWSSTTIHLWSTIQEDWKSGKSYDKVEYRKYMRNVQHNIFVDARRKTKI